MICINNYYRLNLTPDEAYMAARKSEYPAYRKFIEIAASAETCDGIDAVIPTIRYIRK